MMKKMIQKIGSYNMDDYKYLGKGNFNDYQLFAEDTAIYPDKGMFLGLTYAVLGLANEAGEVAGKLKKVMRDNDFDTESEFFRESMKSELGDVLWYLAAVCSELDIELGDVAVTNLQKLYSRKERGALKGSGDNR